jgi:hypothetical protein
MTTRKLSLEQRIQLSIIEKGNQHNPLGGSYYEYELCRGADVVMRNDEIAQQLARRGYVKRTLIAKRWPQKYSKVCVEITPEGRKALRESGW